MTVETVLDVIMDGNAGMLSINNVRVIAHANNVFAALVMRRIHVAELPASYDSMGCNVIHLTPFYTTFTVLHPQLQLLPR